MHTMNRLILLFSLLASGCATYGDESIRDYGSDWPPLAMSKTELINRLGDPRLRTISHENGQTRETLTWSYAEAQANPALMIPVVGLFVAASGNGVSGDTRSLHAVFGPDGKMISRTWAQGRIGNASTRDPMGPDGTPPANRYDPTVAGSQ
ncbi:MAG: hypothetical protein H8K10_02055 [Nitrospira sp.]|nr:hypothetical protein [Nitrospira sp.]